MTNKATPKNKSYAPFLVGAYITLVITGLIYLSSNLKTVAARSAALFIAGALVLPAVSAFQVQLADEQEQPGSVLDNYSSSIFDEYLVELLKSPLSSSSKPSANKPVSYGTVKFESPPKKDSTDESQDADVIDAVFEDGVDSNALDALNETIAELKVESDEAKDISIKSIEQKNGKFIVKINTPQNSDKAAIEELLRQNYEMASQRIKAKYRQELEARDKQINIYRQQSADLNAIVELLASRPIKNISIAKDQNLASKQTPPVQEE
jgi:hypothetical protein